MDWTPEFPTDSIDLKRHALRRNRILATSLLLAAVAVFLTLRLTGETSFAARLLGAAAEAAIVGGLADWFAITALPRSQ